MLWILDILLRFKKSEKTNKSKKILFFIFVFYFLMIIYTLFSSQGIDYVNENNVDKTITQAINNNSNTRVLKNTSKEFSVRKKNIINEVFNKQEEESYYDTPLPLDKVLERLRNENYKRIKLNLELDKKINNGIDKIVTNLIDKNKLKTLYLKKSNMHFYISLIAFMVILIPVFYGGHQFFIKLKNKFSSKSD